MLVKPTSYVLPEDSQRWTYLYRAVDKQGPTVDFLLSRNRDISAARQFFTSAIERHCTPETITLDGSSATAAPMVDIQVTELHVRLIVPENSGFNLSETWVVEINRRPLPLVRSAELIPKVCMEPRVAPRASSFVINLLLN